MSTRRIRRMVLTNALILKRNPSAHGCRAHHHQGTSLYTQVMQTKLITTHPLNTRASRACTDSCHTAKQVCGKPRMKGVTKGCMIPFGFKLIQRRICMRLLSSSSPPISINEMQLSNHTFQGVCGLPIVVRFPHLHWQSFHVVRERHIHISTVLSIVTLRPHLSILKSATIHLVRNNNFPPWLNTTCREEQQ